jgi:hypothetical protein
MVLSSKNSSPDSNKKNTNHDNNKSYNSSFNPLIEGLTLAQSSAMTLITVSSEILEAAPKMIDYWFNIFFEPLTRTSTATASTTEEQKREKVKVE